MLILAHTSFGYVQREVSLLDIYSLCIIFFILLYLYIACMRLATRLQIPNNLPPVRTRRPRRIVPLTKRRGSYGVH